MLIYILDKNKILLLASYSLIKIIRFGVFSIHPVVHSWARERLEKSERLQPLKDALKILGKAVQKEELSRESDKWNGREEIRVAAHLECLSRYLLPKFSDILRDGKQGSENEILLTYINNIALVFDNQG